MSWIDDRKAESAELHRRNRLIDDQAGNVYDGLWDQIFEFIKEAQQKSFDISTNGSQFKRMVTRPVPPVPGQQFSPPKILNIVLSKDKRSISVRGGIVDINLSLDLGGDNVVFLAVDGTRISTRDAAIRILDPLLFPELPRMV